MHGNLLLRTDSYKFTHWKQYPPHTERVYSYMESRGGMFAETVFFGLQYYLKHYLEGSVFSQKDIEAADDFCDKHFAHKGHFNRAGWEYILKKYGGRLPVEIKAAREGTVIPTLNVMLTMQNTDDKCAWLTNYLETLLLKIWYPCTVSTLSREMKRTMHAFLERTGDPMLLPFKVHDFGYRGVSSEETAAIGGAAHLVNFQGTDTIAGIVMLRDFYGAKEMSGFSIPAAEHSTITAWGKDHEGDAYENMLRQYPDGLVSCVSDSFDILKACGEIWGMRLREQVLARDGVVVIRPDSGDAKKVLLEVFDVLGVRFGFTVNEKGYRVINPKVRVIQGDGVNYWTINDILTTITRAGWSADNLAFGIGGALLQQLNRDTQKFAFKCSSITVAGEERDVWKDPVSDPGKVSKRGRLALVHRDGAWQTVTVKNGETLADDALEPVFRNGEILREESIEDIRKRAAI